MYPDVKEKPPFTLGYDMVGIVDEVLPLSEARQAHERVEAGEVAGKLVLRVSEP